jgi:undecaprenyl-diphosphatase
MVNFLEAVILGIVQGLTEWLPISSTGHLVIIQQLFNLFVPVIFDFALHLGTLFAVLVLFRKEIFKILKAILKLKFNSPEGRLVILLVAASISSAPIALLLYTRLDFLFSNLLAVGTSLLATGTILYLTKFVEGKRKIGMLDSVLIGIAQSIALVPGISRSGITLSAGLFRKIDRKLIFEFCFLLSIPALLAANIFELTNVVVNEISVDWPQVLVGMVIAAIVGYLSLKLLYSLLQKGKFYLFSFYCWVVGILVLVYNYLYLSV